MERDTSEEVLDDDFVFYSQLYSSITVIFAMAVMSKFLTNDVGFGFRSFLTLVVLFVGEPVCHFLLKGPTGIALFGIGCLLVYSVLPANHMPADGKTVIITGCDSGFGYELARKFDSLGCVVYAGCLCKDGIGALELKSCSSERLHLLQLDVTNEQQVINAAEYVKESLGDSGLWGLINNAGVCYVSEIEMTSEKIFRKVFDVNLFGVIRVTKAFLPMLRRSKGRIINISSLAGSVPFEGLASYCISKFGIEAYSDVLRLEMKKWGVKVTTIQPAGFNTGAMKLETINERKEEIWGTLDDATKLSYGRRYFDKLIANYQSYIPKYPTDLSPVVRAVRTALFTKNPSEKYIVGTGAGCILRLFPVLPIWISDRLSRYMSISTVRDLKPQELTK